MVLLNLVSKQAYSLDMTKKILMPTSIFHQDHFYDVVPERSKGLRNANHTQTLDLADIYGRFVYEDNLIQRRYSDTKKALITTPSSTPISTTFFSNNVIQDFNKNSDDEVDERTSKEYLRDLDIEYNERALLANSKHFIKRRNNFSSQTSNENTECYKCGNKADPKFQKDYKAEYKNLKAKLALLEAKVSDEEEVTQVKVLMALADDELTVGKSHACNGELVDITIRKVNTFLSMDEEADWQNYLRDELLILKQAKLDAITFQIQNTELTKLKHALQEQLKEEKKINEKWLTSSKKVSQCISKQIPHQKKKVLGCELLTESSSKMKIFSFLLPWVPESQVVNESLETLNTPESSKDSEVEFLTLLPPLKRTIAVSESKQTTSSVPTEVKDTEQELKLNELTKLILRAKAKPFPPCTHCGFNDHIPDDYPECGICGSYDHSTLGHNRVIQNRGGIQAESSQSNESSIRVKCNTRGSTIHSTSDHNEFDHFKRETHQGANLIPRQWMLKEYY
ncbi:hypothetical protein Tco_1482556 [Tanacetum coccineum]